jgi:site-specific recombinase XerD
VKAPKLPETPLEPVSRDDVEKLLDTCESGYFGLRDRAIIQTLLDTGVRAAELVGFNLDDLDLGASTLLVRKGKGSKPRTVYIGKTTRRSLRAWLRVRGSDPGPLFISRDEEQLTYFGLREIVRRRAKDAGIKPAPGLHDFRRAYVLALLRSGVDILSISRMLGHAGITLVARYARQTATDLAAKYRSPVDSE